jgi:putative DNA primase/helicase
MLATPPVPNDANRALADWQGRIAADANSWDALATFGAACEDMARRAPIGDPFRDTAKLWLLRCADNQLVGYGQEHIDQIFYAAFPEEMAAIDVDIPNAELDAAAIKVDDRTETDAEIKRLADLPTLAYERERKAAAKKIGIRGEILDKLVKHERAADEDTKGRGRTFSMPVIEPWPDPVDGAELLDNISTAIRRYVVMPGGAAEIVAMWAVHTHALDSFTASPRLAITAPEKGCGKTLLLDTVACICARPLSTANASASSIFRVIELVRPTLLIDEADTFLKENDELRGVLNSGHRRGGSVLRTVGDDHEPRQFSTWAPVAIAMIGRLPDTLEDRSVTVRLCRRKPDETIAVFRDDRADDFRRLARMAARWAADNGERLRLHDPETGSLFNRLADNWRPLLAIADLAGGEWPERARQIAESAGAAGGLSEQSIRVALLSDIRDAFDARNDDRFPSAELASALAAIEGRQWGEWGKSGKPITANALARLLVAHSIAPANLKLDGGKVLKGYRLEQFEDAFERYLAGGGAATVQPLLSPSLLDFQDVGNRYRENGGSGWESERNQHEHWSGSGVAVENPGDGLDDDRGAP